VPFGATEENVILTELKGDKYFCYCIAKDVHVFYHNELYPCFDSSDYAHENRYYRSYYICSSLKEVQEKFNYLTSYGVYTCNLNPAEKHRGYLAPYVNFDDGSHLNTFKLYEKK
jgi:hypothetical protein